jgi:apolipoprotein N-acyltransferase
VPKLSVGVSGRDGFAAVATGLIGAAALPPIGLYPLALVAPALLFVLIHNRDTQTARNISLVFGITYAISTMYWLWAIFGPQAIPLWALMAGYFGLFGTLVGMTQSYSPCNRAALVATFAVGIEWLRGDAWYLRFPWYTPPHALAQYPQWVAGARFLGVYGLSFAIWFIAAAGAFRHKLIWASFLLLPLTSLVLPNVNAPDRTALLIQAETQASVGDQVLANPKIKVDLAVLPELAFLRSPKDAIAANHGPASLARKTLSPVIFGCIDGDYYGMKFRNLVAIINQSGELLGTFQKQRPVPLMADGEPGTERPVFPIDQGTIGMAICYDLDPPAVASSLVKSGATVLVVPTYDAMSWTRVQHVHHELLLRIRAIETDRWVLRSASSGRTEVIDPDGTPSTKGLEIGETGAVELPYAHRTTYALDIRMAFLGPVAFFGTVLFAVLYIVRARTKR